LKIASQLEQTHKCSYNMWVARAAVPLCMQLNRKTRNFVVRSYSGITEIRSELCLLVSLFVLQGTGSQFTMRWYIFACQCS